MHEELKPRERVRLALNHQEPDRVPVTLGGSANHLTEQRFELLRDHFGVKDIPRRAIYLPGERQSQIKGLRYALRVSPMLLKGFIWRLINKYVLWDFHPLVFFFFAGMTLLPLGIIFSLWLVWQQLVGIGVSGPRATLAALFIITGLQFLLFAMLFDMQEGKGE